MSKSTKNGILDVGKAKSPEELSKMKEEAEERAAKAKEVHRTVTETIILMVDPVQKHELMDKLHVLDVGSWDEIVEERYLGRICGYPTCSTRIQVENYMGKKFWIKKREQKIYTAIPKSEKFCSKRCFHQSNHVQRQLYDEPMWFNWERPQKQYDLDGFAEESGIKNDQILVDEADKLLITRLNELRITEHNDSDSEHDEEGGDEDKSTQKLEDDQFMNEIRSFVTSVSTMSSTKKSNLSGGASTKTDMNNIEAQKKTEENAKKYKTENIVPNSSNIKKDIVKTSSRLEKLIEDITESAKTTGNSQNLSPTQPQKPKPTKRVPKKKVDDNEDDIPAEMKEKLAKLRSKYGQKPTVTTRKPPILIEAPPMAAEIAAKLSEDMR